MKAYKVTLLFFLALILGACASQQAKSPWPPRSEITESAPPSESPQEKFVKLGSKGQENPPLPTYLNKPAQMKTGLLTPASPQPAAEKVQPGEQKQKIILNYDKADVAEVTAQIFGDYLKLNYVIDPTLQGRISLYLEGEFSKKELLQMVTKAYEASNIAIVPQKGIYYIQSIQRSTSSSLPLADSITLGKDQGGTSPIIVIYRLRYVDSKQAINTIKLFLTPGRPITTDPLTNSLVFAEDPENAKTIVDVLRSLDVNILQEVGMEVVPLHAISPAEAVKGMDALMEKMDVFKQSGLKTDVVFIPLERYGGVLVLAQNPEVLNTAKRWITALDVRGKETGEQIYVYFVRNGLARDISDVLNQVFGTGGKSERSSTKKSSTKTSSSQMASEKILSATETATAQPKTQVTQGMSVSTTLTGEVVIIGDEVNNAIVVRANAADYEMVKSVIEPLDIMPRAVLIEVMLAEITLNKNLEYGIDWWIQEQAVQQGLDTTGGSSALDFTKIDLRTAATAGYSLFYSTADLKAFIKLLAEKTTVNVLSTPTLLASDNQEASLTVGGREPIQTGQTVTEGGTTVNSIQYEETGIILNVTPHINEGGQVRMEVDQTIRTVKPNTVSGIDSPAFDERKVKTALLAKDGQTVVIGGIIQHEKTISKSGIPFLQDIPLIAPLFTSATDKYKRTELIIAITPHVIISRDQENRTTSEFLNKLKTLRGRIERGVR